MHKELRQLYPHIIVVCFCGFFFKMAGAGLVLGIGGGLFATIIGIIIAVVLCIAGRATPFPL